MKKAEAIGKAMKEAQQCLDEIHDVARLVGKSASLLSGQSSLKKRALTALLKEIQSCSNFLFASGGKDISTCRKSLLDIRSMLDKVTTGSGWIQPSVEEDLKTIKEREAAENALFVKLELEEDQDMRTLSFLIRSVRQMEANFSFQLSLWQDKQALSLSMDSPVDHFTYGTTSFQLWQQIMLSSPIRERLAESTSADKKKVVIFGASVGLLAFMTNAIYPSTVNIVGYEVLPTLHKISIALKAAYVPDSRISFKLLDMMEADVSDADIIILTSLCWDKDTRQRVAHKLSRETRTFPKTLIIDYRSNTFSEFGLDASTSHYSRITRRGAVKEQLSRKVDEALRRSPTPFLLQCLNSTVEKYEAKSFTAPPPSKFQLLRADECGEVGTSWSTKGTRQSVSIFTND